MMFTFLFSVCFRIFSQYYRETKAHHGCQHSDETAIAFGHASPNTRLLNGVLLSLSLFL